MSKDEKKYYQTKSFSALRQYWYKKIAEEGFFDVEVPDKYLKSRKNTTKQPKNTDKIPNKKKNSNSPESRKTTTAKSTPATAKEPAPRTKLESIYLKNSNFKIYNLLSHMNGEQVFNYIEQHYDHYHAVQSFLSHVKLDDCLHRFMLQNYTNGMTMREIQRQLKNFVCKYPKKRTTHYSIYWVHTHLTKVLRQVMLWNRQHPEGHFFMLNENYDNETEQ